MLSFSNPFRCEARNTPVTAHDSKKKVAHKVAATFLSASEGQMIGREGGREREPRTMYRAGAAVMGVGWVH